MTCLRVSLVLHSIKSPRKQFALPILVISAELRPNATALTQPAARYATLQWGKIEGHVERQTDRQTDRQIDREIDI